MRMKVRVQKVGDRIHAKSDYTNDKILFTATKDRMKAVIGARWSPSVKAWTYPLDLETCRRLRDEFGDDLVILPELWKWASVQKTKEADLTDLSGVQDMDIMAQVDLPVVRVKAPTMWAAMQQRPFQPVASLFMARARRCLNGDQPGIGKTIETLGALVEAGVTGPVLILAPRTSCAVVWEPEIRRWLADDVPFTIVNTAGLSPQGRAVAYDHFNDNVLDNPDIMHFLIANAEQAGIKKFTVCPADICDGDEDWCPEFANHVNKSEKRRPYLHSIAWEAIVADETHKWLINSRGKAASQVGYGFTKLRLAADDSPMYALSGTPLKGKKWNLFGTINWLWPKTYTSKWRWIESFFEVKDEEVDAGYRKGMIQVKTITGRWRSDKAMAAFYRHLDMVMIRRTKSELREVNPSWMPPDKIYHDVYVDMEGSQKSHYKSMEKGAEASLKGGLLTATGILAEMTRLKQFANSDGELHNGNYTPTLPSGKFNWMLQFLEERGIEAVSPRSNAKQGDLSEDVQKVVVASQFTTLINLWAEELVGKGINVRVLTGETADKERAKVVNDFQILDTVRVFLINTTAGGVSITLDAADDIVLMDETWVPDESEQVEDRVHRASNVEHQVNVWYVRTKGTIEEGIAATNAVKAESNHVVLDAQRGLAFAAERFGIHPQEEK